MTNEFDSRPGRGAPDELTRALRDLVAPPAGDGYWDGLESRIMARIGAVAHVDAGPWSVLAGWMRPALVAAAAVVVVSAAALLHTEQAEASTAYETLMAAPPGAAPVETALRPAMLGERDVTLGLLLSR
jgi:hypothetical protein